jgi:D-aminoacyl-tRNA deacylase
MRAVVQRVSRAKVAVDDETAGEIGSGLLVFVGVAPGDGRADASALADKLVALRVFQDEEGRMNRSVSDVGGGILVVSQFTLYADFTGAADPTDAEPLVEAVVERISELGIPTATGRFGAMMEVDLVNQGPVTLVLEVSGGRVV